MAVRTERGPAALSPLRTVALAIGFGCAVVASVTIFVTENAEYLRIGIVIALWGFVFAALAAGRRQTEQVVAASAEVELRKSYEAELEREVAARREYELRLEAQLRREVQEDFTAQVGALHEQVVGLRRELSEQWDSELRVERMVMRTQSVRMAGDRRESLEHAPYDRAGIDAVPVEAAPWETAEHIDEDRHVQIEDPWPTPSPAAFASPAPVESSAWPDGDGPGTTEFSFVPGGSRPVPTAPVPTLARPDFGAALPPSPPYAPHSTPEPDDVLTRVLAESGASVRSRRRQHRYADEDDEGYQSWDPR
jgi:hypothetical protein